MSDFFKEIAGGVSNAEQSMLGPDYQYYEHIRSPGYLGASSDGNMGAMAKDVAAIINYVELLVAGGGRASDTGGPLGPKFYVKTAGKCKDVATKKVVPRYIYIDNVLLYVNMSIIKSDEISISEYLKTFQQNVTQSWTQKLQPTSYTKSS